MPVGRAPSSSVLFFLSACAAASDGQKRLGSRRCVLRREGEKEGRRVLQRAGNIQRAMGANRVEWDTATTHTAWWVRCGVVGQIPISPLFEPPPCDKLP